MFNECISPLYDTRNDIQLTCDALAYVPGAVLSHVVDGVEKPIAFASRSMTTAEHNHTHVEKEALTIVFGI